MRRIGQYWQSHRVLLAPQAALDGGKVHVEEGLCHTVKACAWFLESSLVALMLTGEAGCRRVGAGWRPLE